MGFEHRPLDLRSRRLTRLGKGSRRLGKVQAITRSPRHKDLVGLVVNAAQHHHTFLSIVGLLCPSSSSSSSSALHSLLLHPTTPQSFSQTPMYLLALSPKEELLNPRTTTLQPLTRTPPLHSYHLFCTPYIHPTQIDKETDTKLGFSVKIIRIPIPVWIWCVCVCVWLRTCVCVCVCVSH